MVVHFHFYPKALQRIEEVRTASLGNEDVAVVERLGHKDGLVVVITQYDRPSIQTNGLGKGRQVADDFYFHRSKFPTRLCRLSAVAVFCFDT